MKNTLETERKMWYELYIAFNDDNLNHADSCFLSSGLREYNSTQLHEENLNFLMNVRQSFSNEQIIRILPSAEPLLKEIDKKLV